MRKIKHDARSYGSISYNAHAALAKAATEPGICCNTGKGGLHEDFCACGPNTVVQVSSGRFGAHMDYLQSGVAVEIKMGQGAKPGIGGLLPGAKIVGNISRTRMIPKGSNAISPCPTMKFTPFRICGSWCCPSRRRLGTKSP